MGKDKHILSQRGNPPHPMKSSQGFIFSLVGARGAGIVREVGAKPHTARLSEFRDRN